MWSCDACSSCWTPASRHCNMHGTTGHNSMSSTQHCCCICPDVCVVGPAPPLALCSPHCPINIHNGAGAGVARGSVQQGRCHTRRPAQGAAQQVRACFWMPTPCAAVLSTCTVRPLGCGMTVQVAVPWLGGSLAGLVIAMFRAPGPAPGNVPVQQQVVVTAAVAAGVVALVCTLGDSVQDLLRHTVGRV